MPRRSFSPLAVLSALVILLVSGLVPSAQAQPLTLAPGLTLGAPQRVSDFRFGGVASGERIVGAVPRGDGFLVYEIAGDPLRTVPVDSTGRADTTNARVVFPNATAPGVQFTFATSGSRAVFFWNDAGTARFSPATADGVQFPGGIPIASAAQIVGARCNATHCLLTYYDPKFASRAAIVRLDGSVVATNLSVAGNPVGADDGGFLLLWSTGAGTAASPYETHLVRIDDNGGQTFDVAGDPDTAGLVALAPPGSSSYAVVWSHSNYPEGSTTLYGASLSLDGTFGERRLLAAGGTSSPAAMVWTGSELLLAFSVDHFRYGIPESTQPADLFVQRLSPAVAPLAPPVPVSTSPEANYLAALATNGGATYVGWNEYPNGGFTPIARGAVLDARANVVAREAFQTGPMPQVPLALAVAGDRALAVWKERDSEKGVERLFCARSTVDGTPLDTAAPFVLGEGPDVRATASALASDVLVLWEEDTYEEAELQHIRAAIVHTADGSRIDVPLPPRLAAPGRDFSALAAGSNGESWLVAIGSQFVRISRAGVLLTPQPVTFASQSPSSIAIAGDGSRFFVVWNRYGFSCNGCGGLRSTIVDAAGTIAIPEQRIPSADLDGAVAVAFNGRDHLAVSIDSGTLRLRRFSTAGTLLSSTALRPSHLPLPTPLVTALGEGWFVTWRTYDGPSEGVRITSDATPGSAPLSLPPTGALAPRSDRSALALTTQRIDLPPFGTGIAATLQELISETVPRRRAAGGR